MRITAVSATVLSCLAAIASAGEVTIYPVEATENFCPQGLQPSTINGVISCCKPTTSMTYQEVKAHPVARASYDDYTGCLSGEKGCR